MKTGRFGGQQERSVFSVWVFTGFACCSARKSRSTHAVFRKCSYSGVDSANQQDNEFVPFVNIINEYYVRDGSKKVRTSLRLKGESGEHLTTIPPYGYVKDPDNAEH